MVASPEPSMNNSHRPPNPETAYQEEMCEKLIQLSFAKIVNSKAERGGARLHKNLLILHLLQKARFEQRSRLLHAPVAMDTTSHVSEHQNPSSHHSGQDISCENSVCSMGNADGDEQMERGQLMEESEDAIEIDETASQQQAAFISDDGEKAGTFSSPSYDVHLASPCLSSLAPSSSPESGFDGNCGPETTVTQPTPPIIHTRQHAQENQGPSFDFSIDVKQATSVQLQPPTHGHCSGESEAPNDEDEQLHHQSDQRCRHIRHRRLRSSSVKHKRALQRNHSASASSSSSDSDDSSSSEDSYSHGSDMEGGEEKKTRDCLKRKLDDSYGSDLMAVENSPVSTEWYSSPKMACIVHGNGGTVTETTNLPQQHQSLNGLISVLQSAALTSDEPTKTVSAGKHADDSLAAHIYDSESDVGNLPLPRSMSCPGVLELACES